MPEIWGLTPMPCLMVIYIYQIGKEKAKMISYKPLWETMKKKSVSTYKLRRKEGIGGGTIHNLKKNRNVSTHTLNMLCRILKCRLDEIAEYIEDNNSGK